MDCNWCETVVVVVVLCVNYGYWRIIWSLSIHVIFYATRVTTELLLNDAAADAYKERKFLSPFFFARNVDDKKSFALIFSPFMRQSHINNEFYDGNLLHMPFRFRALAQHTQELSLFIFESSSTLKSQWPAIKNLFKKERGDAVMRVREWTKFDKLTVGL